MTAEVVPFLRTPIDPDNITGKYILDDEGNPVSEYDLMKWARWIEDKKNRRVEKK